MKTKKGRGKGTGTLVLRGKTWCARWMHEGKVFTKTTGTSSRREAESKLEEFTAPFRLGGEAKTLEVVAARLGGVKEEIARHEDAKPQLMLADAWHVYEASRKRPKSGDDTLEKYAQQYARFVAWMAANFPKAKEVRDVSLDHAEAFSRYLETEKSPNTHNKYVILLKRFWKVVAKKAKATVNPWTDITLMELDTHSRRELTVDELTRVCSSVQGEMRVLFALGLYTGLRLGDCARLKWGGVDLVRKIISVIPTKTARKNGKPLKISIHRALLPMLEDLYQGREKGAVYVLPQVAMDYEQDIPKLTRKIKAVFEACGVVCNAEVENRQRAGVDVGFHSLRHTFVSLSANAGTPMAVVQAIVGHANPAMTEHYFHEDMGAVTNAVAALPDVMGGAGVAVAGVQEHRGDLPQWAVALVETMNAKNWQTVKAELQSLATTS